MNGLQRFLGEVVYRAGAFAPSNRPDLGLVELVENPSRLEPGRALDLGCGTGRNSIYLAQHGWDVTGIDMVGHAVATARRKAADDGVSLRLIEGDVTRLDELGIGDGYTLLVDAGCYHGLPSGRRDAYVTGVTRVAAPGALLLMLGFGGAPVPGVGVTADELRRRFPGWQLVSARQVPGEEMSGYIRGPALTRFVLGRGWFVARRYQLNRAA